MRARTDPTHVEEPPDDVFTSARSVNKRLATIDDVTDEDIGFYREYGYLVIEQFLSDEEIEAAKQGLLDNLVGKASQIDGLRLDQRALELDGLTPEDIEDAPPETKLEYFNVIIHPSERQLQAPGERDDLRSLVGRLLGSEPSHTQTMAMTKPPRGSAKEWHQDSALLNFEPGPGHLIGAWIALDEATADNSAMHIVPGSHRDGPIEHQLPR